MGGVSGVSQGQASLLKPFQKLWQRPRLQDPLLALPAFSSSSSTAPGSAPSSPSCPPSPSSSSSSASSPSASLGPSLILGLANSATPVLDCSCSTLIHTTHLQGAHIRVAVMIVFTMD